MGETQVSPAWTLVVGVFVVVGVGDAVVVFKGVGVVVFVGAMVGVLVKMTG